jgi:hypothetical protein
MDHQSRLRDQRQKGRDIDARGRMVEGCEARWRRGLQERLCPLPNGVVILKTRRNDPLDLCEELPFAIACRRTGMGETKFRNG